MRAMTWLVAAVTAGLVLLAGGAPSGAADRQYPVPYRFVTSLVAANLSPATSPPGANTGSCRLTPRHPRPVVLVHGLLANQNDNWQTMSPLLANNGYCVYAFTYGVFPADRVPLTRLGGRERMETSARELARFVDRVLATSGAQKVDILGHSEGTIMPDYYAKYLGGAAKIDKYVSLAPFWHGTNVGGLGVLATLTAPGTPWSLAALQTPIAHTCASCLEFGPGSAFFRTLRAGGTPVVRGIAYTNIITRYDQLVVPYTSGIQRGMRTIVLQDQCSRDLSEHFEIAADPIAAVDVLNALDPAHPQPVPCRLVLPYVG